METATTVDMFNISKPPVLAGVETAPLHYSTVWLWKLCPPVILVLGTFGNVMTIAVLRRMSARQSAVSVHVYFTALAVSDLVLLPLSLTGSKWAWYAFGLDFRSLNDGTCKILTFAVFMGALTSAWFLVFMTIQRATSVMWPHRANLMCTESRARAAVFIIVIFCVIVCTLFFLLTSPLIQTLWNGDVLSGKDTFFFATQVYPWVDLMLSSILPFCILAVCNVLLVWKVAQSVQTARSMGMTNSAHVSSRQRKASSLTVTLSVTSTAFLVLTLPICLCTLYSNVVLKSSPAFADLYQLLFAVSYLLWSCNSAVNFYLYCLSGTKFRNEFKMLFCKDGQQNITTAAPEVNVRTKY